MWNCLSCINEQFKCLLNASIASTVKNADDLVEIICHTPLFSGSDLCPCGLGGVLSRGSVWSPLPRP